MASSGPQAAEVDPPERAGHVDRERGEALVLELLGAHADSLLRVARRYSMWSEVVLLRTTGIRTTGPEPALRTGSASCSLVATKL